LWAALVLDFKGHETSKYLPYLEAAAAENSGFFPESFLYILTRADDYLNPILSTRFKGEYWSAGGDRFYDTALGLLALQNQAYFQIETAKSYLLNGNTQNTDSCWNNLEDTGFLLYAGWPLIESPGDEPLVDCEDNSDCLEGQECIEGYCVDSDVIDYCEDSGYYCLQDCNEAGGEILTNYECTYSFDVCCTEDYESPVQTCEEAGGEICEYDETCPYEYEIYDFSGSGICCEIGECIIEEFPEESECEKQGYSCHNSCFEDEEKLPYDCYSILVCCGEETITPDKPVTKSRLWIIILIVIVILLIVLIVIFRNKIKLFLFKIKTKFKKGPPVQRTRPVHFPPGPRPRARPVPARRMPVRRQPQKTSKDKEFDDTLKKLRDMSK